MSEKLHIALILDGNRRFAKKQGFKPWKGHEQGVETVENLLGWCRDLGIIHELTLYVFSDENFKRSAVEKKHLMRLFKSSLDRFREKNTKEKYDIRFKFIGDRSNFSKAIQKSMEQLEESSKDCKGLKCNIAMGYGGRAEIIRATKKISEEIAEGRLKPTDINEEMFSDYLYLATDPDILIRTGKEVRLSNFLLWQICYTELFFMDKLWPEFTEDDLKEIIEQYHRHDRRFGK
jgi:undecaprenyl diphosphate synthase